MISLLLVLLPISCRLQLTLQSCPYAHFVPIRCPLRKAAGPRFSRKRRQFSLGKFQLAVFRLYLGQSSNLLGPLLLPR